MRKYLVLTIGDSCYRAGLPHPLQAFIDSRLAALEAAFEQQSLSAADRLKIVAELEEENRQMDIAKQKLRVRRNARCPAISMLSDDVLSVLFQFVAVEEPSTSKYLGWVRLSHVSSHWRAILHGISRLWADNLGTLPSGLEDMAQRAGDYAPLTVWIKGNEEMSSIWPPINPHRLIAVERIRAIHVTELRAHAGFLLLQKALEAEFPKLEVIEVRTSGWTISEERVSSWKEQSLQLKAPLVDSICFENYFIPWTSNCLTHLTIMSSNYLQDEIDIPLSLLLDLLSQSRLYLTYLKLEFCTMSTGMTTDEFSADEVPKIVVDMPRLRTIAWTDYLHKLPAFYPLTNYQVDQFAYSAYFWAYRRVMEDSELEAVFTSCFCPGIQRLKNVLQLNELFIGGTGITTYLDFRPCSVEDSFLQSDLADQIHSFGSHSEGCAPLSLGLVLQQNSDTVRLLPRATIVFYSLRSVLDCSLITTLVLRLEAANRLFFTNLPYLFPNLRVLSIDTQFWRGDTLLGNVSFPLAYPDENIYTYPPKAAYAKCITLDVLHFYNKQAEDSDFADSFQWCRTLAAQLKPLLLGKQCSTKALRLELCKENQTHPHNILNDAAKPAVLSLFKELVPDAEIWYCSVHSQASVSENSTFFYD